MAVFIQDSTTSNPRQDTHINRVPLTDALQYKSEPSLEDLYIRDWMFIDDPIRGIERSGDSEQRLNQLTIGYKLPTAVELYWAFKSAAQELKGTVPVQTNIKGQDNYTLATELATQDNLTLLERMNQLHRVGCGDFKTYLKGWNRFRYILGSETCQPGEFRRSSFIGYEYGEFASSAPSVIEEEMQLLVSKLQSAVDQINGLDEQGVSIIAKQLRMSLIKMPFLKDTKILETYDDKEVVVAMVVSELHRMLAHIHPWFERTGRTAEEVRIMISTMCGVRPIVYSSNDKRLTNSGRERGFVEGLLTYPVLKEIGNRTGITSHPTLAVKEVFEGIYDTSNHPVAITDMLFRYIYSSKFRMVMGDCCHPDHETCVTYYSTLHTIMMELLNSFEIGEMLEDKHTLYHTSHLLGRGYRL